MAHVFVEDLDAPMLGDADRHHLERVLRTRVGDALTASDGRGRWASFRLGSAGRLIADGEIVTDPSPTPAVTVGFAVTKGERPELVVQKLTELGVDRMVPFLAARSVARWEGDRAARHVVRLRAVAREAAMQSRRSWLPTVDDVRGFAEVVAIPGAAMADAGGAAPSLARPTVLVGPEGGWSDDERAAGLPTVGLGPHVLRAETAAIAAAAALGFLRAGLLR
ncbi:MAG: 16S rRNA (uracil(1498)-N(3))-methyltransferase [Acidobacteria bacterium]|nr:16S rRNA (uracil(1498)-N(3))-methyltransferase [Acidobacteriota bacterium]